MTIQALRNRDKMKDDKNSPTGHPSPDKWIPLEINNSHY
jgi:hypothetical protein